MPKFYLTTAIDYSNGDPHLGHALEKVGADCIARYRRLRGDDVHFLMGMDEHSQAVIQAAEQNGTVAARVGRPHGRDGSRTSGRGWRCSNDDWIRTTEPRHHEAVTELLRADPAAESRRSLRRRLRGPLLHRMRRVQAAGTDRQRPLHRASHAGAGAYPGAEPLLPAEPLPRHAAATDHAPVSSGSTRRSGAMRSCACSRTASRTSRSPATGSRGAFPSPATRTRPCTSGSMR